MRKYTFELVINEGSDEFWEGYNPETGKYRGYATCEEIQALKNHSEDMRQLVFNFNVKKETE
tara:strand:- start:10319 stop:10504 length:186 start_codon:yes stop_codon:yes gene_type:complete